MDASRGRPWIRAALLAGLAYVLIGRIFAVPATHVRAWRWAAWLASGVVFATHIGYEHFKPRSSPRLTASHAAAAVALGALGLAVAGMIHTLSAGSPLRPAWLLALVVWPAITGLPAFLVALAAGALLARLWPGRDAA